MAWRVVSDEKHRAKAWVKAIDPDNYPEHENFSALISEYCSEIRGVVIYTDWYPTNSIDMHVASLGGRRWLTRAFLHAAFAYPFEQLALRRVTGRIAASNCEARRFIENLGFVHEGTVREGWPQTGEDLVVYGMLKRECRFIRPPFTENRQTLRSVAA